MGKRTFSDFLVDTNDHCFICLNKVILPSKYKTDESGSVSVSRSPHSSLHRLTQYLKMDMSKVFHEKESIPPDLLDNVKRSKLKALLCGKCKKWNERISELCRQLEKIETEVSSYVELICGSLVGSEEDDKTSLLYKFDEDSNSNNGGLLEKVRIVRTLRTEAKQKCSEKLSTVHPRVKVHNLTANQLLKMKQSSKVKSERQPTPWKQPSSFDADQIKNEAYDGDGNEYFDDNVEPMEDTLEGGGGEDEFSSVANLDPHLTRSSLPIVSSQSDPLSIKQDTRSGIHPAGEKSSVKVLPPNSSIKSVEKLTFEINPKTGKFRCNICSKETTQKSNLQSHYNSLHLKIKHKCNLCGKEFTNLSNYKTHHKSAHVGVRFKCNLCGKCFTRKQTLIEHQQSVHTGK